MQAEKAIKYLGRIPNINHGGCLVSAFSFYLNEKKENRHEHLRIVSINSNDNRYEQNNRKYIEGKRRRADSSGHFGWTYDGVKVFDTDGLVRRKCKTEVRIVIPPEITEKFCRSALNHGGWNPLFNRKHIPKIEKHLGIELKKVWRPEE